MAKKKSSRSGRGKAEGVTGAKEGAVEVSSGLITDGLTLPDKDRWAHHRKSLIAADEAAKTANSRLRKARQAALADSVSPDAIFEARRIVRANDPAGTAGEMNQLAFALQQEGFRIQITLFDTMGGDQLEQVYKRFYQDGKDGKVLDNRYPPGSDLFAQAARAWRHGFAANLNPPQTPAQADAALDEEDRPELQLSNPLPPAPDMTAAMH